MTSRREFLIVTASSAMAQQTPSDIASSGLPSCVTKPMKEGITAGSTMIVSAWASVEMSPPLRSDFTGYAV